MVFHLLLVQHALTEWNLGGRTQGHTDVPLAPIGREMSLRLAARLAEEDLDALYTSDLKRAYQTAEPLAHLKGMGVRTDPRLREGRWEWQDWDSEYPILPWSKPVEEREDVRRRVAEALEEMTVSHPDGRVLVISHGGAIREALRHMEALGTAPFPDYKGERCSLNRLEWDGRHWHCRVMNEDGHLDGIDQSAATKDAG